RCPSVPWSLDALAAKCLAFEPAARYARARDLAEDLHRFLDNLPMKHGPEPSFRERTGKFAKRHPVICGTTSIALFAIVLIGLLIGGIAKTYGALEDLYARVKIRQFDRDFTESQFLLNTPVGSDEHFTRGLKLAKKQLDQFDSGSGSIRLNTR